MGLLVDGPLLSIPELKEYDSSLLDVASTEGIDLTAKLRLTQEQVEEDVALLLRRGDGEEAFPLDEVVATESLRRWFAYRALEMTYRDAYFSQLNDRYGGRWKEYKRLAEERWVAVRMTGVGRNGAAMRRPGAPVLSLIAGSVTAMQWFVRTSWVNALGDESAASETAVLRADAPHGLMVQPGPAPLSVTGWHVYAGSTVESVARQTTTALATGTVWMKTSGALEAGAAPGRGQEAESFYVPGQQQRR
jgi:hypothetical protein